MPSSVFLPYAGTQLYPSTHRLTPRAPFSFLTLSKPLLGVPASMPAAAPAMHWWLWLERVLGPAGWLQSCVALLPWHLAGPLVKGLYWGMLWLSPKSQLVSVCSAWQGGRKIPGLFVVWLHQKKAPKAEGKYREWSRGSGCWWDLSPWHCLDLPTWLWSCLHLSAERDSAKARGEWMSSWSFAWPAGSTHHQPSFPFLLLHSLGHVIQYVWPCLPTTREEGGFQPHQPL